jgi:hypothetical protein
MCWKSRYQQFGPSDGSADICGNRLVTSMTTDFRVEAGKEFYIVVTGQSDPRNVRVETAGAHEPRRFAFRDNRKQR